MSTLAERGVALLNRFLPTTQGVVGGITYSRTGVTSVTEVPATYGRTLFKLNTRSGAKVEWGERDYIIEVLRIATMGLPKQGDRITHNGLVYEVSTPDTNEPHWRYSDNLHLQYRIHTKRVI